jgi:hypothetical protein
MVEVEGGQEHTVLFHASQMILKLAGHWGVAGLRAQGTCSQRNRSQSELTMIKFSLTPHAQNEHLHWHRSSKLDEAEAQLVSCW